MPVGPVIPPWLLKRKPKGPSKFELEMKENPLWNEDCDKWAVDFREKKRREKEYKKDERLAFWGFMGFFGIPVGLLVIGLLSTFLGK